MIRSLFSGVSGMKSHQIRMDVIGNNIANVNTVGFKRGRANFEDTLYQSIKSSSKSTNPAQAGLGTSIASISSDMNSGGLQATGRTLDLAINGEGFFKFFNMNKSLDDVSNDYYGREGTLYIGNDGSIFNSNGYMIMGRVWDVAYTEGTPNLLDNEKLLNGITFDIVEHKEDGTTRTSTIVLNPGMTLTDITDTINAKTSDCGVEAKISEDGNLVLSTEVNSTSDFEIINLNDPDDELGLSDGYYYCNDNKEPILRPLRIAAGFTPVGSIKFLDDGSVSGYNTEAQALKWVAKVKDASGMEEEQIYNSAMIKLFTFPNQDGLLRVTKNIFTISPSSGKPVEGVSGSTGYGTIESGYLEMSNVDLTDEFSTMITTQRGYQASARMITISDTMLEELLNLKR